MWGSDNKTLLNSINDCTSISLGYLKDNGYVDANIKNTYTGELFEDTEVFVNITLLQVTPYRTYLAILEEFFVSHHRR